MTARDTIARLAITLEDVDPAVIRRLEVPLSLRLDRLHQVLQIAMGWTDSHLYEIRVGETGWGIPEPDWDFGDGPLDARKTSLREVIDETGARTLTYLYDFGDGWDHTIRIERIGEADANAAYPRLLEASGRCPPEDVGGPPGYQDFLEAIADPDHEDHDELREWAGGHFDPHDLDIDGIAEALAELSRRWSRRSPRRQKHSAT